MEPGASEGNPDPEQQKLVDNPPPANDDVFEIRYGGLNEEDTGDIYYEYDMHYRYGSEKSGKLKFIRKVYLTLLVQLIATAAVCAVCMYNSAVRNYVINNPALYFVGIILMIVLLITLWFVKHIKGWNLFFLVIWTLVCAYTIGVICGFYVTMGYRSAVIYAFGLTIALFLALTLFTIQSKWDFSFLPIIIFTLLFVLIIWGIIMIFTGYQYYFWYSLLGAIVFCLLIIFDTWWMLRRGGWYDEGAWIMASINLYLDVINLFLFILSMVAGRGGGGRR